MSNTQHSRPLNRGSGLRQRPKESWGVAHERHEDTRQETWRAASARLLDVLPNVVTRSSAPAHQTGRGSTGSSSRRRTS